MPLEPRQRAGQRDKHPFARAVQALLACRPAPARHFGDQLVIDQHIERANDAVTDEREQKTRYHPDSGAG